MSGFTDADTRAFFDPAAFGVAALVNGAFSVNGILDENYVDPLGMASTAPVFACAVVDWATPLEGDVLDIGARRWAVVTVEPDGTGIQALRLRRIA